MKGNRVAAVFTAAIIAAGFLSCSLDYEKVRLDEELSGSTPNAVLINFTETAVRKGDTAYRVSAEKAETFDRKKLTVFTNLYFAEYDGENGIATEGTARKAEFQSDNEDIAFREYFSLNSHQQGYYIEGESVSWNGTEQTLTADRDKSVRIGREDGSYIEGRGFSSSAADRSFSFSSGAAGAYVSEEDSDE